MEGDDKAASSEKVSNATNRTGHWEVSKGLRTFEADLAAITAKQQFWHHGSEVPPPEYADNGPIDGPLKYLGSLLRPDSNLKEGRRRLKSETRVGTVWVQSIGGQYRMYFRIRRDYELAKHGRTRGSLALRGLTRVQVPTRNSKKVHAFKNPR